MSLVNCDVSHNQKSFIFPAGFRLKFNYFGAYSGDNIYCNYLCVMLQLTDHLFNFGLQVKQNKQFEDITFEDTVSTTAFVTISDILETMQSNINSQN